MLIAIASYGNIGAIWMWVSGLEDEAYIAMASGVIAIIALWANIREGKETRKHNRLSVQPLLRVLKSDAIKGNVRTYKIILINHGVGPAIIKNFELLYNGKRKSLNDSKTYSDFLKKKISKFKGLKRGGTNHRTKGYSIKMGEELILWKFECDKHQDIEDIEKVNIRIEYQSIYRDKTFNFPPKK